MSLNPWKKLSSRLVYSNPYVSLLEDQVLNPDGSPGVYAVLNIRYAIGVMALDSSDNIYLVGQYRYATEEYAWEVVEGGVDDGEEPIVAAKRELEEEVGLVADDWIQLGSEIHISNCHTSERGAVFLARNLKETSIKRDSSEILEVKMLPLSDAFAMLKNGEIKDALSNIALYRLANYLGKII